jgi:4-amino-4-deoxy-L-arabinose transferase-like glycosyltransferase
VIPAPETQKPGTRNARTTNRWIVACVLVGLALRLAFALLYWVNQPLTHDEREYLALARSVARGDGFRYPADEPSPGTAQQFGRAPGYPLFLAALRVTTPADHAPRRVQVAQACVGALGIWLIAAIAGRAVGPRAGVAAAAIAAVYPPLIWMPAYVLSETLFSALALAAALALQTPAWRLGFGSWRLEEKSGVSQPPTSDLRPPLSNVLLSAVLTGLAILTRPAMAFFVPFAALWFVWRRRPADALIFSLVSLLCVAPWTIRNHRVYGRWIAVASEGGVTFWTGNHPLARGEGDLAANLDIKRAELAFRAAHPTLTPEQLEPLYYQDALRWIRREPAAWLALVARKAYYTVVPAGPSYALHSERYRVASIASYLLILSAAIAGVWRWRAARTMGSPAALWLMAAATVAAGLVFFPQERFRIPVIDPALIVTAALLAAPRDGDDEGNGFHNRNNDVNEGKRTRNRQ